MTITTKTGAEKQSQLVKYSVQLVHESICESKDEYQDSYWVKSPQDAEHVARHILELHLKPQEHFVIFALDTKSKVIGVHTIHVGTIHQTLISMQAIFQRLLLNNAFSFVALHNHPSGVVTPSPEDIQFSQKLVEAGKLMSIQCVDHIIIGENRFISLRDKGYM